MVELEELIDTTEYLTLKARFRKTDIVISGFYCTNDSCKWSKCVRRFEEESKPKKVLGKLKNEEGQLETWSN